MKIAVIGLGYVGLPLIVALSHHYECYGYDLDQTKIGELTEGTDRTGELDELGLLQLKNCSFTSNLDDIRDCNVYIVTVPTPVKTDLKPDMSYVLEASTQIGSIMKENDLVVYESTVFPGATEELCVPELEKASGLCLNKDFHVGYSPERINPGDKVNDISSIVKVVSASSASGLENVRNIYLNSL